MLKSIIQKQLKPEYKELKEKINKEGIESIIIEYPNLKEIVENITQINKEVEKWMKLSIE